MGHARCAGRIRHQRAVEVAVARLEGRAHAVAQRRARLGEGQDHIDVVPLAGVAHVEAEAPFGALLPEFRTLEAKAGRSVPVMVWGLPKEPELLLRDRDLGVARVVLHFDAAKAEAVLPQLDRYAALIPKLAA